MAQDKAAMEHYVPQTYLKSFANDKEICYVYDKKEDNYFTPNISNIMGERYFYDIPDEIVNNYQHAIKGKVDKQMLEKLLSSTVDGYWKNIVENIKSNYEWFSLKYSWNYVNVYKCIAIQLLRTPRGRKLTTEFYSQTYNKEVKEGFENIFLAKEISEVLKDVSDSFMIDYLLNEFGHICVGINNTDVPFITADNPILLLNNYERKENEIIYYPIMPNRCIILMKRAAVDSQLSSVVQEFAERKFKIINDFSDISKEAYAREKALMLEKNPLTKDISVKEVIKLNTAIYMAAERFVVSSEALNSENKIIFVKA